MGWPVLYVSCHVYIIDVVMLPLLGDVVSGAQDGLCSRGFGGGWGIIRICLWGLLLGCTAGVHCVFTIPSGSQDTASLPCA